MDLIPKLEYMRINTKAIQVFLVLELQYIKIGLKLLKNNFVVCPY